MCIMWEEDRDCLVWPDTSAASAILLVSLGLPFGDPIVEIFGGWIFSREKLPPPYDGIESYYRPQ